MGTWAVDADRTIAQLAEAGDPFSADDLIAAIGPPDPTHAPNARNNAVGAAFSRARMGGLITVVGHAKSTTPTRKGGLIRVWQGVASQPS
jgi:hypothetical protein